MVRSAFALDKTTFSKPPRHAPRNADLFINAVDSNAELRLLGREGDTYACITTAKVFGGQCWLWDTAVPYCVIETPDRSMYYIIAKEMLRQLLTGLKHFRRVATVEEAFSPFTVCTKNGNETVYMPWQTLVAMAMTSFPFVNRMRTPSPSPSPTPKTAGNFSDEDGEVDYDVAPPDDIV